MWKRGTQTPPPSLPEEPIASTTNANSASTERGSEKIVANIGKSVIIKGELNGSENLSIEGEVEGKIELKDHILTIGQNGRVHAQIQAKSVVIMGKVVGNIIASERVLLREGGSVEGDIQAPRISIAEGSSFRGKIDMQANAIPGSKSASTQAFAESKSQANEKEQKKQSAGEEAGGLDVLSLSTAAAQPKKA